ncbi:carbohydrate ABC transporter permease [Demequina aurantiaca]|uniref:carbohydrate ABC transporter permease n=1 Tax=Demequina aurantiaca TaxID=676200 RepID=UPI003D3366AA
MKRKSRVGLSVLAIVISLVWIFPVYWMLNSAFLPTRTLERFTPTFLPFGGSWRNFSSAISDGTFYSALGMSVAITLIVVFFCILFAFLAALAISRFKFRGRKSFILAVLLIQMLPAEALFLAQYKMMSSLGLLNSVLGVSVIYVAAVVPFTIWMLRGFVAGVPADLEEAAMVDGLSRFQAFMRITFPLLAPGLVAAGVYAFLQAWNEFTVALVLLPAEDAQTLPLWLQSFVQSSATRATDWGEVMAASTLVAVPVIVFFMIVQGRMTSGLVSGAVKG